jgi:dienelactone hydrolase
VAFGKEESDLMKRFALIGGVFGVCFAAAAFCMAVDAPSNPATSDWKAFFDVPDFKELPPAIETLSEKTADGVTTTEFYMAGAPFNGKPTKIYGFYSRPVKPGKYPGVLELHGAGLFELKPDAAIGYATNGFCCVMIDWAGQRPKGQKQRTLPYSQIAYDGRNMAASLPGQEKKPWPHVYKSVDPKADGIRNGVMFARRAVMFLKSRPEVDSDKLCIAGMSAGAHLTLLILGVEPSFKAAAVKYGCGFIRDMPGYFGGYFSPLVLCSKPQQDAWLAWLDPKLGLANYRASVLLLSGTDDIFFWMPVVLKTYRAIPTDKRLLMLPNDNHSQVGNWQTPLRYFKAAFGMAPAWPTIESPSAKVENGQLRLSVKATGPTEIAKGSFWVKRMPKKIFRHGKGDPKRPETQAKWTESPAQKAADGAWTTAIPAPAADEQVVAYATVEDSAGVKTSSDTVESPAFPEWRGMVKK